MIDRRSRGQCISNILCNYKSAHTSPPLYSIVSHLNVAENFRSCMANLHFNIISAYILRPQSCIFPSDKPIQVNAGLQQFIKTSIHRYDDHLKGSG